MKTSRVFLVAAVLVIAVLAYLRLTNSNNSRSQSQQASFSGIKCTVAKFLLDDIDSTRQIAPLFENLGNHSFSISTDKTEAQIFFNQGLRLTYAFNHAEAHRSFMEASRLDPNAAMPYWGQAYTLGPNINDAFPASQRKIEAFKAIKEAKSRINKASPLEKALITALEKRYSSDTLAELKDLNQAYMEAMAGVVKDFPEQADVQTLYAASVMNTMPWLYWDNDGNPSPNTLKGKAALEEAIRLDPDHPGAHHYYIHMVELPFPDLAVASADKLGGLMPAAGHLVHMPSHIYIRVGRYMDAVKSNQEAILADEDYISQCYSQGMYPLGYYPHNIHFLWSAASLMGASEIAIEAAQKTAEKVPVGELDALPFLQDFAATPLLAYTRFGKWNDILTVPPPNASIKHLRLIWHYSRGIAFTRKGNLKEAEEELQAISEIKDDPEMENLMGSFQNNTAAIAKVAYEVVAGEIAALKGESEMATKHFEKGIQQEDQLIYSEPPAWYIPVRQNLGAHLMNNGKYAEAEKIFREDLKKLRQNGWSLMGLHKSLEKQGKKEEARSVRKEFDKAWEHADLQIDNAIL